MTNCLEVAMHRAVQNIEAVEVWCFEPLITTIRYITQGPFSRNKTGGIFGENQGMGDHRLNEQ